MAWNQHNLWSCIFVYLRWYNLWNKYACVYDSFNWSVGTHSQIQKHAITEMFSQYDIPAVDPKIECFLCIGIRNAQRSFLRRGNNTPLTHRMLGYFAKAHKDPMPQTMMLLFQVWCWVRWGRNKCPFCINQPLKHSPPLPPHTKLRDQLECKWCSEINVPFLFRNLHTIWIQHWTSGKGFSATKFQIEGGDIYFAPTGLEVSWLTTCIWLQYFAHNCCKYYCTLQL